MARSRPWLRVLAMPALSIACASSACHRSQTGVAPQPGATGAPAGEASVKVALGGARRAAEAAKPHEKVDVPGGRFFAGSLPGDEGRDPTLEPLRDAYELAPYSIDVLPYPGEPGVPPLTAVTSGEAAKLCAARGERLCTELEWERACRGPSGDAFSAGEAWDPSCVQTPDKCISGFGARMMGASLEEWTSSSIEPSGSTKAARVAVKGAYATSAAPGHRCAVRHAFDPYGGNKSVGFRCCSGGDSAAEPKIATIEAKPTFRKVSLEASRLTAIFAAIPELARVRVSPHLFKETELAPVFEAKGLPDGEVVTSDPVLWSPVVGEELLVVAGKSKGGAFVVALHRLPGDQYRLASSMLFPGEQGPIALVYQQNLKKEILWTMGWKCAGEGGAVTYRDDHRVVVVQR